MNAKVSSNSESFASKTKRRLKSGRQFSLHEPTHAPEQFVALIPKVCATARQDAILFTGDVSAGTNTDFSQCSAIRRSTSTAISGRKSLHRGQYRDGLGMLHQ